MCFGRCDRGSCLLAHCGWPHVRGPAAVPELSVVTGTHPSAPRAVTCSSTQQLIALSRTFTGRHVPRRGTRDPGVQVHPQGRWRLLRPRPGRDLGPGQDPVPSSRPRGAPATLGLRLWSRQPVCSPPGLGRPTAAVNRSLPSSPKSGCHWAPAAPLLPGDRAGEGARGEFGAPLRMSYNSAGYF